MTKFGFRHSREGGNLISNIFLLTPALAQVLCVDLQRG